MTYGNSKEEISASHVINIAAMIGGMVLIIRPSFIFCDEITETTKVTDSNMETTAMAYITFAALFFQSNTFVLERKLKGNIKILLSIKCHLLFYTNIIVKRFI